MKNLRMALLLAQMKRNQWKTTEELETMQEEKLIELVNHASEHVPHYRKTLKEKSLKNISDLSNLPLTSKKSVNLENDSFISRQFKKRNLKSAKTSGSSGTPMVVYHHNSESHYGPSFELHQLMETGIGPFDATVRVHAYPAAQYALQHLGIFRRSHLSLFDDESKNLLMLKKMKPRAIMCPPSYLASLAHKNITSESGIKIEKIFSFAEMLSERVRKLVTTSFQCELYDMYGSVETSWIAWQCGHGSMHLFSDFVIAEIIDGSGNPVKKGDYGRIVLTPLWRRSMPLIRYVLGDQTAFGPKCPCGRGSHTLKPIEGRSDDLIVMPSGNLISPRIVDVNMRFLPGILLFQAVQEDYGQLHLKIVPSFKPPSNSVKNQFIKNLKRSFPEPMDITIEFVEDIPRGKSGKIKSVISKLKPNFEI